MRHGMSSLMCLRITPIYTWLEMIRMPLRRAEKPVCLVVPDNRLPLSVEDQLASEYIGEIAQDAEDCRAVGDFDIDVGEVIGRLDRLEPLSHMV